MKNDLFNDLLNSVEEAGAIRRGEQAAERTSIYKGKVLIEIRERDTTVWTLGQAAGELRKNRIAQRGVGRQKVDPRTIRKALKQTQEGFAELLGVSVRTLQNWEQGRRDPVGPARRLLDVAFLHPVEVLDAVQAV